ncbi:MAG: PTS system mannose/fructose/sorbose family transporter subunit IID [Candidatus Eisenbacteria bacterium]|nr:PTS system mannose/fructose/sorbose family transporter subunit IID [Candidatus Eisenbacteria bacterium]
MSARITRGDLRRMAARTFLLQATFNYERQQGLGWAWAMQPALDRLYADPGERRERLAEHTAYFNTQPTLASLALGAAAGLEERRAAGEGPDAAGASRVRSVLGSALAALGDRFFWFTLRPFAACLGVLLALSGSWVGAPALLLCYNVAHLGVRWRGVGWGYRAGPEVMSGVVRRRFERLTAALGVLGAALVGVTTAFLLAPGGDPRPLVFQVGLAAGLGLGLVAAQRPRPSPTEWALGVGALCLAATWLR